MTSEKSMKKLFGTDGIRGEAGIFPLNVPTIEIIGKSLAKNLGNKNGQTRFVIGRDTRESGEWIEDAFCKGANSENAVCRTAGIITTPGIAFLTKNKNFDAGVVISASHNPYQDNGIKIFLPSGKKIDGETEKAIERDIFENNQKPIENLEDDLDEQVSKFDENAGDASEMQQIYMDFLADEFKDLSLETFKMVMDCANGAASEIAPKLFKKFVSEVVTINNRPDGKNINENCGSLHIGKLQKKVLEENADFGVAFDGDADRSLFVDEKGQMVDGDAVLWIMGRHLQENGELENDTVIATVMSNIGLQIALDSKNIKLLRTDVGDKYVLKELLEKNCSIGGEQSGHIIFPKKSLVGDGMFTTLYLLEALSVHKKSLSEMTKGFEQFPQILVNVKVREKIPFENVPEIAKAAEEIKNELGEKGRLLLRFSGTENLARVMIEGEDQQSIEEQANRLAAIIKENLG